MKRHIIPFISVAGLTALVLSILSHLVFNVGDAAGQYCAESPAKKSIPWMGKVTIETAFPANSVCWGSGYELIEGFRYLVTVKQKGEWTDGSFIADVGGFEIGELTSVWDRMLMYSGIPFRRVIAPGFG